MSDTWVTQIVMEKEKFLQTDSRESKVVQEVLSGMRLNFDKILYRKYSDLLVKIFDQKLSF